VGAAAARAAPGTCPGGQYASATTTSGVTCSTPSGSSYTLPAATSSALGGVKCGSGTTCAGDGTMSVSTSYDASGAATSAVNAAVSGSANVVPKFTSAHVVGNSQISDDGTTMTLGNTTNALTKITGGTGYLLCGQLSDATAYGGCAFDQSTLNTGTFGIAGNVTTGTILNANAGKTVLFNVGNVNYASVTSAGISASNISATPTASAIPKADGSGTLNSWVTGRVISSGVAQFTSGLVINPDDAWHDIVSTSFTYATGEQIVLDASALMTCSYANSPAGISIFISANGGSYTQFGVPGWSGLTMNNGSAYFATLFSHAILTGAAPGTMIVVVRGQVYSNSAQVLAGNNTAELRVQVIK